MLLWGGALRQAAMIRKSLSRTHTGQLYHLPHRGRRGVRGAAVANERQPWGVKHLTQDPSPNELPESPQARHLQPDRVEHDLAGAHP